MMQRGVGSGWGGVFVLLLGLLLTHPALAQFSDWRSGESYVGIELGVVLGEDLIFDGSDNDPGAACDQILRAASPVVDNTFFRDLNDTCSRGDMFGADFELDEGLLLGAQAGRDFGNWRAEAEYLYRSHHSTGREPDRVYSLDKGVKSSHSVSDFASHSLFLNLYYDFPYKKKSFTPYVGLGAGWSKVEMLFDGKVTRSHNLAELGDGTPPIAAGATTHTEDQLGDDLFGWQLLAGVDYAIDERWSIGAKFRYAQFDDFKDSDRWDQLRSHESSVAADSYDPTTNPNHANAQTTAELSRDPTVLYTAEFDDLGFWSIGLNLKYRFGGE